MTTIIASNIDFECYERMAKVHSQDVVKQKLTVDLQITEQNDVIDKYIQVLFSPHVEPVSGELRSSIKDIASAQRISLVRNMANKQSQKLVTKTHSVSTIDFDAYEKMAQIHPQQVVRQRVLLDLQLLSSPIPSEVEEYFAHLFNFGESTPASIKLQLIDLAKTKTFAKLREQVDNQSS